MTGEAGIADAELVLRAQAGDRRAFESLVRRHKSWLYRLVRRCLGTDTDTYDVVQESFVSAWMALNRFDAERDFSVWLRIIALNKCRDFGRRQTVRRRVQQVLAFFQEDTQISAEQFGECDDAEQRLRRLDKAIAKLPAFYKEPLLLTTVAGLSQQETAKQLGTTAKAIEMRIRRAKKRLTAELSEPDREG